MRIDTAEGKRRYLYPSEASRHAATILGFPSKLSIAAAYYESACFEIASLASAISAFEPVRLFTRPEDIAKAQAQLEQSATKYPSNKSNITIIPCLTNHLWVRDTGPVYVNSFDGSDRVTRFAINFRFSEWGRKDAIGLDDRACDGLDWPVMQPTQLEENATFAQRVIALDQSPSPVILVESKVCLEGGALVVDGDGTLLATESSILNDNRNPGLSRSEIEEELHRLLGVEKIIWFPGRKGLDVTDVHADAEVVFIRPGVVVLSRPHPSAPRAWIEIFEEIQATLQNTLDARGRHFEIHTVDEPDPKVFGDLTYDEPATNYVNCYFINGGLILPQFGDVQRDQEALALFQVLCPDRVVQPVHVTGLPLAGGVIHCSTQPVLATGEC
ncbi:Peptidyl-arginine deiminase Porphyromonas-type [Penicillium viridicatum]|nr:Peptidyl-arginine deiminase Porphyromonas-type [Penicillium viridicatum]